MCGRWRLSAAQHPRDQFGQSRRKRGAAQKGGGAKGGRRVKIQLCDPDRLFNITKRGPDNYRGLVETISAGKLKQRSIHQARRSECGASKEPP